MCRLRVRVLRAAGRGGVMHPVHVHEGAVHEGAAEVARDAQTRFRLTPEALADAAVCLRRGAYRAAGTGRKGMTLARVDLAAALSLRLWHQQPHGCAHGGRVRAGGRLATAVRRAAAVPPFAPPTPAALPGALLSTGGAAQEPDVTCVTGVRLASSDGGDVNSVIFARGAPVAAAPPLHAPDEAGAAVPAGRPWYVVYPHHRVPEPCDKALWRAVAAHYHAVACGLRAAGADDAVVRGLGVVLAVQEVGGGGVRYYNVEPCVRAAVEEASGGGQGGALCDAAAAWFAPLAAAVRRQEDGAAPGIQVGEWCVAGGSLCPYFARCRPDQGARVSVFSVAGLGMARKVALYKPGQTAQDVYAALAAEGKEGFKDFPALLAAPGHFHVDAAGLSAFLDPLRPSRARPVFYLDFEAIAFPSPCGGLRGSTPYQPVPVQYSLHVDARPGGAAALATDIDPALQAHCDAAEGTRGGRRDALIIDRCTTKGRNGLPAGVRHYEYLDLAPEAEDAQRRLAESLVDRLPRDAGDGTVVVWSAGYERMILHGLAGRYPDLRKPLEASAAALVDLRQPFLFGQALYRDAALLNSSSLKHVAARLGGLSYAGGGVVHNGFDATAALRAAARGGFTAPKLRRVRGALLRYGRLDTASMLAVASALQRALPVDLL